MTERIYLDNAATTPLREDVLEAMLPYFRAYGYNPSSLHAEGRRARAALDEAREQAAGLLGASRKEIVFTAGGSESDTLAIVGTARALRGRGRHLVSTAVEHHAVLHALEALREEGWEVTLLGVDAGGTVDPEAFAQALRPQTVLASVMYANNELGTVQPIAALARIAHERGVLFHTDAVQVPLYREIDVRALGVDLLSLSAHKFHGPKGAGLLYVREGTPLQPIICGGSQEYAKRAGTENLAGIVGMVRALALAAREREELAARVETLREGFERTLLARVPGARVNGGEAPRLPNISSVSVRGARSEQLLAGLDLAGIAVSAGSACASGSLEPSHVVAALGLPPEWMQGVIRFSLGRSTSAAQLDRTVEVLAEVVSQGAGLGMKLHSPESANGGFC